LEDDIALDGILVDIDVDKVLFCKVVFTILLRKRKLQVYVLSKFPVLPAAQQLSNNLSPILARFFPHQQNVSARPPLDPSADQKLASLQVQSGFCVLFSRFFVIIFEKKGVFLFYCIRKVADWETHYSLGL
jgi:hypothetical protein